MKVNTKVNPDSVKEVTAVWDNVYKVGDNTVHLFAWRDVEHDQTHVVEWQTGLSIIHLGLDVTKESIMSTAEALITWNVKTIIEVRDGILATSQPINA
jgi:hypothetical protein